LNADLGEAIWATLDDETDTYTSRFVRPNGEGGSLKGFLPYGPPGLLAEAPTLPLAAPVVEVLGDDTSRGTRTLKLRVWSR